MRRSKWILIELLILHGQVSASCMNFQWICESFRNFANQFAELTKRRKEKNEKMKRERNSCYLKPTIVVGPCCQKTQERKKATITSISSSFLRVPSRIFYPDLLRAMTIRKLSSFLAHWFSRNLFYPLHLTFPRPARFFDWRVPTKRGVSGARTNRRIRIWRGKRGAEGRRWRRKAPGGKSERDRR